MTDSQPGAEAKQKREKIYDGDAFVPFVCERAITH